MADIQTPIVVVRGKPKSKRIKELKRGEGKLMDEVAEVLELVRSDLGDRLAGKELVPVVLIYRRKRRPRGVLG